MATEDTNSPPSVSEALPDGYTAKEKKLFQTNIAQLASDMSRMVAAVNPANVAGKVSKVKEEPSSFDDERTEVPTDSPKSDSPIASVQRSISITQKNDEDEEASLWLQETHYGEHWHNAGVIVLAVVATWFVTGVLRGGLSSCILILATCATYYSRSIKRTRRNMRDDVLREIALTRLDTDEESVEWLNAFLARFWIIYEPVLCATIVQIVDPILAVSTPAFLDSLSLTKFTLGTKSPRLDGIRTYPRTEQDVVQMDWELSFTPNDNEDLTLREAANKVNPKIVLTVRVGKGMVGAGMPVLLEDIAFKGRVRIQMKLMNNFPHVKTLGISFLDRPEIDYKLKPVGGETLGFDVANIPGLHDFIRDQIHTILSPMMYAPAVFELDLETMLSGGTDSIDSAGGVLQLTVRSARGLPKSDIVGKCDPYVRVHVHNRAELGRTEVRENTLFPVWNETLFILLKDLNEPLTLEVVDWNNLTKDVPIGYTTTILSEIMQNNKLDPQWVSLLDMKKDKERGELQFDAQWHPVLEPIVDENGAVYLPPTPPSDSGILRINIHQCKELDAKKSMAGKWSPYAEVLINNRRVLKTRIIKRSNNPVWEETVEVFVPDINTASVKIQIRDDRGMAADPHIGHWEHNLATALEEWNGKRIDWRSLRGNTTGKLKATFGWRPITMDSSIAHKGSKPPPLGVLRFHFAEAEDLRNVELLTGGKSDPYVQVSQQGEVICKTEHFSNNLNPKWNELHYVIIRSSWDAFALDVMDYNEISKHKKLGATNIDVQRLMGAVVPGVLGAVAPGEVFKISAPLYQDDEGKKSKGILHYDATFFPIIEDDPDLVVESTRVLGDTQTSSPVQRSATSATSANGSGNTNPSPASATSSDTARIRKEAEEAVRIAKAEAAEKWAIVRRKRLKHNSGILRVLVRQAKVSRRVDACAEIYVTGQRMPVVCTDTQKKTQEPVWDHVGEAFVRDLERCNLVLRIFDRQNSDNSNVLAHWSGSALERLKKQTVDRDDQWITIDENSSIRIGFDWIPIEVGMHESEHADNRGTLHVEVLDATDLPAADSGGTSDPYIVFEIEGEKVHKTKHHKKTLNPVFNERFSCQITNKYRAALTAEIKDHNMITSSIRLGMLSIPLSQFDDGVPWEQSVPLQDAKSGHLRLRIKFILDPEVRMRMHKPPTSIATITAVSKAANAWRVKSMGSIYSEANGSHSQATQKRENSQSITDGQTVASADGLKSAALGSHESLSSFSPTAQSPQLHGSNASLYSGYGGSSIYGGPDANEIQGEPGALTVTIVEASDLVAADNNGTSDPYIKVRWDRKELHKTRVVKKNNTDPQWNETFVVPNIPPTPVVITFQVKDHNFLGSNVELGVYELRLWDHIKTAEGIHQVDFWSPDLEGVKQGRLHLRLEFQPKSSMSGLPSPKLPSKLNLGNFRGSLKNLASFS